MLSYTDWKFWSMWGGCIILAIASFTLFFVRRSVEKKYECIWKPLLVGILSRRPYPASFFLVMIRLGKKLTKKKTLNVLARLEKEGLVVREENYYALSNEGWKAYIEFYLKPHDVRRPIP